MRSFSKAAVIRALWILTFCSVGLQALSTSSRHPTLALTSPARIIDVLYPETASRRDFLSLSSVGSIMLGSLLLSSAAPPAWAVADCLDDCFKNCKRVAPKDPEYCVENCKDYCEQEDRTDGLSGSISAETGEVGLLGGTFGQGTVPRGEDRVS
jgi:hypothetical protein